MQKTIVDHLKNRISGIQLIYHFGSSANQQEHPGSDIDIAFYTDKEIGNLERWEIQEELARVFVKNVDLLDLRKVPIVMQYQIITTGKLIFALDEQFMEMRENQIYSMYLDFNEQRKEFIKQFEETGTIYG